MRSRPAAGLAVLAGSLLCTESWPKVPRRASVPVVAESVDRYHDRIAELHGRRVSLPNATTLAAHWQRLFGEPLEKRQSHSPVVVILHCGNKKREYRISHWRTTYLAEVRHLFASDTTNITLGTIGFPDDHKQHQGKSYPGSHRPLTSIQFANDTWRFDWIVHGDDDTKFSLPSLYQKLFTTNDPKVPLVIGTVGPRHAHEPQCFMAHRRSRPRVDCCLPDNASRAVLSFSAACPVDLNAAEEPMYFEATSEGRMEKKVALNGPKGRTFGCAVVPSDDERKDAGFPWAHDDAHGRSHYHFLRSWMYGGNGYVLSRGMLDAIPRESWRRCDERLVCYNGASRARIVSPYLARSSHAARTLRSGPAGRNVHLQQWIHVPRNPREPRQAPRGITVGCPYWSPDSRAVRRLPCTA